MKLFDSVIFQLQCIPCMLNLTGLCMNCKMVSLINRFQNSYKQTLCVEMLQHGYHKSFSEIFGLIKQQADARISAGPDSSLWNQRPLTEEHDKLNVMKQYLMEAESAALTGISDRNIFTSTHD